MTFKRSRLWDEVADTLDTMGAEHTAFRLAFTIALGEYAARSIGKRLMCNRWVGCHWH